jgi:hypothetical protein
MAAAQISGPGPRLAQVRLPRRRRLLRRRLRPLREAVLTDELAGDISLNLATNSSPPRCFSVISLPTTIPIVPGAP